jgi:formylmethanofuran dehydrogenase subunit D
VVFYFDSPKVKTMELKNGDSIVIKDRDGNVFVDVKVVI